MSNVPPGARVLLDLIGRAETKKPVPEAYNVIIKFKPTPKPLVEFTLDEVLAAQKLWAKSYGGSAAGRYQIIRKTLLGLLPEIGAIGSEKFNASMQDRLAYFLLIRRGYLKFMAGDMTTTAFAKGLSQEWASIPVLMGMQGAHRMLDRGDSYYRGDGVNGATVKPEDVEAALVAARAAGSDIQPAPDRPGTQVPPDTPKPSTGQPAGLLAAVIALILAAGAAILKALGAI